MSVLPLTVNSGAAQTKPPDGFLSIVSIFGMTPSIGTPVMGSSPIVECVPQSHVVMPDTTPTHGGGQPPLALDPFTAITPDSV